MASRLVVEAGQAHVENLDHALFVHQQVGRLDVAMDDALGMGEGQPAGGLADVIDGRLDRQRAVLLDQRRQVLAVDVFHHQEVQALALRRRRRR